MPNLPPPDKMKDILAQIRGFRFQKPTQLRTPFEFLLTCGGFTTHPPTPYTLPLTEYLVRFENNAAVLFDALITFEEFRNCSDFFSQVHGRIPKLAGNNRNLDSIQNCFCKAREKYLEDGCPSEKSALISLVDKWMQFRRISRGRPMDGAESNKFRSVLKTVWDKKVKDGSLLDAGQSIYADDVARGRESSADSDSSSCLSETDAGSSSESSDDEDDDILPPATGPNKKRKRIPEPDRSIKRHAQTVQRTPLMTPEPTSDFESSPPCSQTSGTPGDDHRPLSDKPTPLPSLESRVANLERSNGDIWQKLAGKDQYITKTVVTKLEEKLGSVPSLEDVLGLVRSAISDQLKTQDIGAKKVRKLQRYIQRQDQVIQGLVARLATLENDIAAPRAVGHGRPQKHHERSRSCHVLCPKSLQKKDRRVS